jgi:hypothetical protein
MVSPLASACHYYSSALASAPVSYTPALWYTRSPQQLSSIVINSYLNVPSILLQNCCRHINVL